jgi:hypothetical protein
MTRPSRERSVNTTAPTLVYEPPSLLVLGSVRELTLGANGSVMDSNGRAAHGKVRP